MKQTENNQNRLRFRFFSVQTELLSFFRLEDTLVGTRINLSSLCEDVALVRETRILRCSSGWDVALWMRCSGVARAPDSQCLGSIPASSGTMESEGRQMKQCWIKYIYKKIPLLFKKRNWLPAPSSLCSVAMMSLPLSHPSLCVTGKGPGVVPILTTFKNMAFFTSSILIL
jgi:hypothetical protein